MINYKIRSSTHKKIDPMKFLSLPQIKRVPKKCGLAKKELIDLIKLTLMRHVKKNLYVKSKLNFVSIFDWEYKFWLN